MANKLELHYPVKPFILGQKFGETAFQDYYITNGIIFAGHNGLDLGAANGVEVRAAHEGIAYKQHDDKGGWGVLLVSEETYDYKGQAAHYKTIYWHLIDNIVVSEQGTKVKAGELLGYADSTGVSTGSHLHFGLKPAFLKYPNDLVNFEQNNGFMGAIDPMPYFNGKYAVDLVEGDEYVFSRDIELGDENEDVFQLQRKLKKLGYFPIAQDCTYYYGKITRAAVFAFQKDYIPNLSWMARNVYQGRYCYQQTRAVLNNL